MTGIIIIISCHKQGLFQVQFNYKFITDKGGVDTNKSDNQSRISAEDDSDVGSGVVVLPHSVEAYHIHPLNLMVC